MAHFLKKISKMAFAGFASPPFFFVARLRKFAKKKKRKTTDYKQWVEVIGGWRIFHLPLMPSFSPFSF
jgi:hypothetical protein